MSFVLLYLRPLLEEEEEERSQFIFIPVSSATSSKKSSAFKLTQCRPPLNMYLIKRKMTKLIKNDKNQENVKIFINTYSDSIY